MQICDKAKSWDKAVIFQKDQVVRFDIFYGLGIGPWAIRDRRNAQPTRNDVLRLVQVYEMHLERPPNRHRVMLAIPPHPQPLCLA